MLLRALAFVHTDWQLQILGSGPLYDSLAQLTQELNIAARVHFAPWVASGEMPQFYNSLDILVVPSLTQPNWKEQFGRVIMEAMATGLPVISTDIGGIPEMVVQNETGFLVQPGDSVGLAGAIEKVSTDRRLVQRFGQTGYERAQRLFSIEQNVRDLCALLP